MSHLPRHWQLLLACSLLATASPQVLAQGPAGIKWRTDYQAARKEAEEKRLPLFIDFVRPNCPPCARMEQYTFTDPRILATLNQKFIPLKINGLEEVGLASRLGINLFPTIVLASPEGRVAKEPLIGYMEADALHEHLQRLLASLAPSDTNRKDYENALKWEADGEYTRAITALRGILDDEKARPTHKDAGALLEKIEKRAEEHLARARDLQTKGQFIEALESLTDVRRQFSGIKASRDAADMMSTLVQNNAQIKAEHRAKRVKELLTQAQGFYKTKDYVPCLDRCEVILASYGDLPEGQQAFLLASEIKNNPEWLQAAADVMTDRLGGVWLSLADSYLKRGDVPRARFYLENVLRAFPGSRMAESAQIRLGQLQTTMPVRNEIGARP